MLPPPPLENRVITGKGSKDSTLSRSTVTTDESASLRTPGSDRPAERLQRVSLLTPPPPQPEIRVPFRSFLHQPDRHIVVFSPSDAAPREMIAENRSNFNDDIMDWWRTRSSESGFHHELLSICKCVLGGRRNRWLNPDSTEGLAVSPQFQVVSGMDMRHFGTSDKRVCQTLFWKTFADAHTQQGYAAAFETNPPDTTAATITSHNVVIAPSPPSPSTSSSIDIDGGIASLKTNAKRLTFPDMMLMVASADKVAYDESRKNLRKRLKRLRNTQATSTTQDSELDQEERLLAQTLDDHGFIPDDLASEAGTAQSSVSGSSHSSNIRKRKLATRVAAERLDRWFAIPGIVAEYKVAQYFAMLCQLLGYLVQVYEACGTRLGLLVNRGGFARVFVIEPDSERDRRVAIETAQQEWWGKVMSMEQVDSYTFANKQWIPNDICTQTTTPPDDGATPPPGQFDHTENRTYTVPDWHVIQRLVDFVELGRDNVKCLDSQQAPGREELFVKNRSVRFGDPFSSADLPVTQTSDPGQHSDNVATGSALPPTFELDLGDSRTDPSTRPALSERVRPDLVRSYELIARGARTLKSIPPPAQAPTSGKIKLKGKRDAAPERKHGDSDAEEDGQPTSGGDGRGAGGSGPGEGDGDGNPDRSRDSPDDQGERREPGQGDGGADRTSGPDDAAEGDGQPEPLAGRTGGPGDGQGLDDKAVQLKAAAIGEGVMDQGDSGVYKQLTTAALRHHNQTVAPSRRPTGRAPLFSPSSYAGSNIGEGGSGSQVAAIELEMDCDISSRPSEGDTSGDTWSDESDSEEEEAWQEPSPEHEALRRTLGMLGVTLHFVSPQDMDGIAADAHAKAHIRALVRPPVRSVYTLPESPLPGRARRPRSMGHTSGDTRSKHQPQTAQDHDSDMFETVPEWL